MACHVKTITKSKTELNHKTSCKRKTKKGKAVLQKRMQCQAAVRKQPDMITGVNETRRACGYRLGKTSEKRLTNYQKTNDTLGQWSTRWSLVSCHT